MKGVADPAQIGGTYQRAKATKLTRVADRFEKNPAIQNINSLILKHMRLLRQLRKRLKKTIAKGKEFVNAALQLEEKKAHLKLVLDDPMVLDGVRKKCLEELGEVAVALAGATSISATNTSEGQSQKRSMQPEMQTDTNTDDFQILDETAELRALFERKTKAGRSAVGLGQPQEKVRTTSAENGFLAEPQIQAELQASSNLPIRTRQGPEQQTQSDVTRALWQQTPHQDRRSIAYTPTASDIALGLKWTLSSCETVRNDLDREIKEGGKQPYVAGHIAVMGRKVAILQHLAQERDAPLNIIENESIALESAMFKAELLVKLDSVRKAHEYLRKTDNRNALHLTLQYQGAKAIAVAMNRKRKYEDDIKHANSGSLEQDDIGHRVKRRCPNRPLSKVLTAPDQHHKPQASIQRGELDKSPDRGLLDSRHTHATDGCISTEIQDDLPDLEDY